MKQAFPDWLRDGMTLRDYFAAKAMQSLVAIQSAPTINAKVITADAYKIADMMLEAGELKRKAK